MKTFSTTTSKAITSKAIPTQLDFFQGAIIDQLGNEIPITEAMIQAACNALDPSLSDSAQTAFPFFSNNN